MTRSQGVLSVFLENRRNREAARYIQGKRLLDAGCNTGHFRAFLPEGVSYVGIDPHPPATPDFEFYSKGAADDLSSLGAFDTIALIATIEHIHDYQAAVTNLASYLSPGGRLIITTPTRLGDRIHHFSSDVGLVSKDAAEDHDHIFTLEELERVIHLAGLGVVAKKTFLAGMNQLIVGEKKK